MTGVSDIQTIATLNEHGLVISLRNPDELELAYRWALNGGGVSFRIRIDETTDSKDDAS